ncbi:sodium:solute symporter family protein [Sporosarcina sp. FSL W7-1349]|uniref:sodium:solute symporter family protein n=1 Tax=Sporosarcina sp. FSL W7-1349 TaxID=2921561 RepID=UPI0030FAE3A4
MLSIIFISIFFIIIFLINAKNFGVKSFDEYATARGSFGVIAISLAVFSTWYVGATFTAFAGYSVGYGFMGMYVLSYATLTMLSLYLVAEKSYIWGKKYHISTQAELMDLRYKSKAVRVIVGVAGVAFTAPWLLMEWITQGFVFSYATGGTISPVIGMLIGIVVVLAYVSFGGMKSVITANIFQGAFMFFVGITVMFYMIFKFFGGFNEGMATLVQKYPETLTFPGPGWEMPTAFWTSIIITSGLGGFMWPWVFNKIFASDSIRSIKQSALIAPIIGAVFYVVFQFLGNFLYIFETARMNPEEAFLWAAAEAGPLVMAVLSTVVMATSIATVSGIIQAMSTSISRDVAGVIKRDISEKSAITIARISVVAIGTICAFMATVDVGALINIALLTYQGIIMIFPVVLLGLYWKRANKEGALVGMIVGTIISMSLTVMNPSFIGSLGWTPGVYGLITVFVIMIIYGAAKPVEQHVEQLWTDVEDARTTKRKKIFAAKNPEAETVILSEKIK